MSALWWTSIYLLSIWSTMKKVTRFAARDERHSPRGFLSGDLLITECSPLFSGETATCISLALLDFCKSSSCQQTIGLRSQIYRCSVLHKQLRHGRYLGIYLSENKLTHVQSSVCKWWCICDTVHRQDNKPITFYLWYACTYLACKLTL